MMNRSKRELRRLINCLKNKNTKKQRETKMKEEESLDRNSYYISIYFITPFYLRKLKENQPSLWKRERFTKYQCNKLHV
jgi:hypothetical protein